MTTSWVIAVLVALALAAVVVSWLLQRGRRKTREETFVTVFRASPDPVLLTRLRDGALLEINDAFLAASGLKAEELVGRRGPELGLWVDDADRERWLAEIESHGRAHEFEAAFHTATGERICSLSTERVELGDEACLITIVRDVTDARRAEARLLESERRRRSVIEALSEGILLLDVEGRLLASNNSAEVLLGLDHATLAARSLRDDPWPALREDGTAFSTEDHPIALTLREGGAHEGVVFGVERPGGALAWLSLNSMPLRDDEGRLEGAAVSLTDVTARRRSEAEREQLIAELAAKNAELERFTYGVSHDLKSPLFTIRGFLGHLERDLQAGAVDRVAGDVARIRGAADRMQKLLGELLELWRVGHVVRAPERVPLEAIVREALIAVAGSIAERGVEVEVGPELPVLHGDRARLVGVVQNLIDNAVKFMGSQPRPRIEVGGSEAEGVVTFWVRDNGVGLAPEHHERVFGLFERLDAASEGSGVGLALVKRVVERHGGWVGVESDGTGHGSTFRIRLPQPDLGRETP